MQAAEIRDTLQEMHANGRTLFVTSSFQTHSIPLLHIISTSAVPCPVLFMQTRFHFPETHQFRRQVTAQLGLDVHMLESEVPLHAQRDSIGRFLYVDSPDWCCNINKVSPLRPWLQRADIWINGVRRDQSETRKAFSTFEPTPEGATRFHPMLDWSPQDIFLYRRAHDLPEHPLEAQGYLSIGCAPCTRAWNAPGIRGGRWEGSQKTECGLHLDLVGESQ